MAITRVSGTEPRADGNAILKVSNGGNNGVAKTGGGRASRTVNFTRGAGDTDDLEIGAMLASSGNLNSKPMYFAKIRGNVDAVIKTVAFSENDLTDGVFAKELVTAAELGTNTELYVDMFVGGKVDSDWAAISANPDCPDGWSDEGYPDC